MEELLIKMITTFLLTVRDVAPIGILLVFFQTFVLKSPVPNLKKVVVGFIYVITGLALFLIGLEQALFPLGDIMAKQLTDPAFITGGEGADGQVLEWWQYYWVYIFAAAIGFSTTVAEPSLIAVAMKASDTSGGTLKPWGLRIAVAIGVALSIALGAFRIVTGTSLAYYMMAGYLFVIVQTIFAPKTIIPLAYDSGGVTTSTVTVPLVTALGLGLASTVPGRSPLVDGFGLIALASLFPMITVMGYAQISQFLQTRNERSAQ
ncbi:DUF1538 domain-containing protein [Pseudemcibacter aquimaris]|uniref:DUF1538 domain-containing protein n=1 Tax=Pseudemcibacter aquimaris TaxID=2857064 RepID=UPI002012EB93|nr:DUF1538 domain-containing protein [Pseudemcibacter aquimaris]MCC3861785.1 DUF1538 domain-containing protein [Pseudemcibacter aquimaris]WDU58540.1 DUF1538 domain-containing protein [Pseudemcibacter aquimaris]